MPVILTSSTRVPSAGFDRWCAIAGAPEPSLLHQALRMTGVAERLEMAFDASVEEWWNIAQALSQEPTSIFAHTPACASNVSDFGLMLAWTRLVDEWSAEREVVLVVCDDPWLFRHLATRPGVGAASRPPALWMTEIKLRLRGVAARFAAAKRFSRWARELGRQAKTCPSGRPSLLVYAHPTSTPDGYDAYFGALMRELPELVRLVHIDGTPQKALPLCQDQRGFSLHGFGDAKFAKRLRSCYWRPVIASNWLIRRAAALEGATAQGAAIAWQIHCVVNWMDRTNPKSIAWPWENHSWERALVRAAKSRGIPTIGYQHATVGWREWNYAPHSNPDGAGSLPDRILTVGQSDLARLMRYGCPRHLLSIGGALRFPKLPAPRFDPQAPVFVALPFDADIARQMIDALRPLAEAGRRFLVKDHPMSPFSLTACPGIEATGKRLDEVECVSAVVYCLTTVGLESVLAGLPTLRFMPEGKVPVDVMPESVTIPTSNADGLARALDTLASPPPVDAAQVFATADVEFWRKVLAA